MMTSIPTNQGSLAAAGVTIVPMVGRAMAIQVLTGSITIDTTLGNGDSNFADAVWSTQGSKAAGVITDISMRTAVRLTAGGAPATYAILQ